MTDENRSRNFEVVEEWIEGAVSYIDGDHIARVSSHSFEHLRHDQLAEALVALNTLDSASSILKKLIKLGVVEVLMTPATRHTGITYTLQLVEDDCCFGSVEITAAEAEFLDALFTEIEQT